MSALRRPSPDEAEHLDLPRGEPGGVVPRRGARPAPQPAHAALAQSAADDGRRGPGAEALQVLEGPSQRAVALGTGAGEAERERPFVRASQGRPEVGRAVAVPRPLGRVGAATRALPPPQATCARRRQHGKVADRPWRVAGAGPAQRDLGLRHHVVPGDPPATRPRRARPRPGPPLQLAGRLGQGERLVERGHTSGSPRRARTRASTVRANTRGTGHVRRSRSAAAAESAACVQRPRSSSTRARQATRNRRQRSIPRSAQYCDTALPPARPRRGSAPTSARSARLRRERASRRLPQLRRRLRCAADQAGHGVAARPLVGQAPGLAPARASVLLTRGRGRAGGAAQGRPARGALAGTQRCCSSAPISCRPWLMPSTRSPPVGPGRWSSSGARRASARPLWFGSSAISDATRRGSSGAPARRCSRRARWAPLFDVLAVRSQLEGHSLFLVHALGAMFRLRAVASSSTAHLDPAHRIDRNPGARRHQGARGPAAADQASSRA